MMRFVVPLPVLLVLAACAAVPPVEPSLPPPPPEPPRTAAARVVPRAAPVIAEATPEPGAAAAPEPAWRVTRDGVVGCADRAALGVLSQGAEGAPRVLVEARAAGGCRTTFRVNEWVLAATEADTVQLRMTNGAPLILWFRRAEVVAP